MKEKITLTLEQAIKEKARQISKETGWSVSKIFELLIGNSSTQEIKKLHEKELKSKN